MKRLLMLLLCLPALATCADGSLVDFVDPFIGTGAHGHTYPGATLPFGMVQLSPDTRLTGWDGCSGYHFSDDVVYGFSHTHLSGTGVGDYCDILFMPFTGEPVWHSGYPDDSTGYGSHFDKASETAAAGYYAVHLDDYDIDVELTATPRTGLHRYVFPPGEPAYVMIDLEHRDELLQRGLSFSGDTIEGMRRSKGWARDQMIYFTAKFSRRYERVIRTRDRGAKLILYFGDEGGELLAQVATSSVGGEGSRLNLEEEWADFDFDLVRRRARTAWHDALARFELDDASAERKTIFATALYHSFLAPNLFSDADGMYRGHDLEHHYKAGREHYTVFSLWDTYRATHPLFTLVERDRTLDFVESMLSMYRQSGRLPVWELAANETDCMIGYHSVSVIADAYLKGIRGFDEHEALAAMAASADEEHFGLESYKRDGFIGADRDGESVSKTLEYAYDDWAIARMADEMGQSGTAARFDRRAQAWRHLLDPETLCFRPRENGRWLTPYDPRRVDFHHTEANGWQYRFYAPHHAREHIAALGGDAAFTAALDSLFEITTETTGRTQSDITGLIGQYAHGNEPSHHTAWLYHFTGRPEKTIERVGAILRDFYTDKPDGLIGNEDCGQMSSWYVLAAMGLYDVAPGSRQWLIIPPLHERMSVTFEDGKVFTTRRVGSGDVARVTWNGRELRRSFLRHEDVIGGGELVFELGEAGDWGRAPEQRPGLPMSGEAILPAPYAVADGDRFRGETTVTLTCADPAARILWTTGRSAEPDRPYAGPVTLEETTILRFRAREGDRESPIVEARFDAIDHDWKVEIASIPNPQYTAGGPDALIDGRRGLDNWRTGHWHGYQAQDFVATLDLGEPTTVTRAGASLLQDMRSWIWMPRELVVEVSGDGETFVEAGRVGHDVPDDVEGVFREDLTVDCGGRTLRYLRFTASTYGTIPDWHPGAGGEAFIFLDELIVE